MDEENFNSFNTSTIKLWQPSTSSNSTIIGDEENGLMDNNHLKNLETKGYNNYWALLAFILVLCTAAGNILVCLAIAWERRLQNVTNYFLMSLAITDLMVAILVMPLGILTLVRGYFPLQSEHCLAWICLDVLFCTASIMHLCTISVDRYLSLRYPMRFGRNKTRRRVTLKIVFVWILSIAMSLPLSLMYSKDHASVLVDGTCQIPDPVYKLVGSIVCFYIPLGVMLLTYWLTVRLLARQRQNLGGTPSNGGWASGWLGQTPALERRCTWKRLLKANLASTQNHPHSGASTDTELSTLDTHELWLPDTSIPEPTPKTMTALHQFGAEMFKLSRGLETVGSAVILQDQTSLDKNINKELSSSSSSSSLLKSKKRISSPCQHIKRRASTSLSTKLPNTPPPTRRRFSSIPQSETVSSDKLEALLKEIKLNRDSERYCGRINRKLSKFHEKNKRKTDPLELPPPCTCPYFGENTPNLNAVQMTEVKIIPTSTSNFRASTSPINESSMSRLSISDSTNPITSNTNSKSLSVLPTHTSPVRGSCYSKTNSVVTWDSRRYQRRGSSFGGARTSLLQTPSKSATQSPLRRSATLRHHNNVINGDGSIDKTQKAPSSPCLLQRTTTIRSHHSRNSSVISRNSSRHGRIIRLEQKATKVLGVVFFTFVILWAPFFVLNLLPSVCADCEAKMSHWVFDIVTWLGYASSMVNPIFYTIFNKVFRQAFKKVLMCEYRKKSNWRPHR